VTLSLIPDTLPGHRGRDLILVGFAAALRPSELSPLDVASLTRHEDGIALLLPGRKNDQKARGTEPCAEPPHKMTASLIIQRPRPWLVVVFRMGIAALRRDCK